LSTLLPSSHTHVGGGWDRLKRGNSWGVGNGARNTCPMEVGEGSREKKTKKKNHEPPTVLWLMVVGNGPDKKKGNAPGQGHDVENPPKRRGTKMCESKSFSFPCVRTKPLGPLPAGDMILGAMGLSKSSFLMTCAGLPPLHQIVGGHVLENTGLTSTAVYLKKGKEKFKVKRAGFPRLVHNSSPERHTRNGNKKQMNKKTYNPHKEKRKHT